jgi:hypothetical protein
MSEGVIKVFIACGWIAAGLNGVGNLLVATRVGGFSQPILRLIDPRTREEIVHLTQGELTIAFFVIAYGIYRRSRIAALAILVIFVMTRAYSYGIAERLAPSHGGASFMASFWISTSFFVSVFVLAVIGTFAWHARQSAAAQGTLPA